MNMIKCYNRFLAKPIFWLINIVYPLAAIIFVVIMKEEILFSGLPKIFLGIMISTLVLSAEVLLDHWIFGGAFRKDSYNLELIKCSPKGRTYWKNVLIWDSLRRVISVFLIGILTFLFLYNNENKEIVEYEILFYFTTSFFTFLCVYVCRFFQSPLANMIFVYISLSSEVIVVWLLSQIQNMAVVVSVIVLSDLALLTANYITGMKVFERSYRDE